MIIKNKNYSIKYYQCHYKMIKYERGDHVSEVSKTEHNISVQDRCDLRFLNGPEWFICGYLGLPQHSKH